MNNRNDTIDVLRIVMAYIIVVYHSFLLGLPYFPGGYCDRVFLYNNWCLDESFDY